MGQQGTRAYRQRAPAAGLCLFVQSDIAFFAQSVAAFLQKKFCSFIIIKQFIAVAGYDINTLCRFVGDLLKESGFFRHAGEHGIKSFVDDTPV